MTTIMFWVGLGAMVLGWLTSSLPMVVMGAGIFIPASLIAGIVGILNAIQVSFEAVREEDGK